MKINVHAGHNPDGKVACGAIGLIKESTEARKVKDEVIRLLIREGHTVFDCTVDDGKTQANVLNKIVQKCNKNKVDLDVSIHFNAGANDTKGNEKSCGTEVLVNKLGNSATKYAKNVAENISKLGFRNRGVKESGVYFLRKTNAPAILIECCFVDDKDDINLYNPKTMAKAIVEGILNKTINTADSVQNKTIQYGVEVYDFDTKESAESFSKKLWEIEKAQNNVFKRNNGKWGIKVYPYNKKETAENFKKKLKDKYNAGSLVYSF